VIVNLLKLTTDGKTTSPNHVILTEAYVLSYRELKMCCYYRKEEVGNFQGRIFFVVNFHVENSCPRLALGSLGSSSRTKVDSLEKNFSRGAIRPARE
jgi:hypothetical protein